MNGDLFPVREGYAKWLGRFYEGLYPDTPALQEYVARGLSRSIVYAPGRMVDQVDDMLKSYQKNRNQSGGTPVVPGANALFPIIVVAIAKDYIPTGGDFGGRQVGRRLVRLTDEDDASVYGYRQAMGDLRTQVVIMAAEQMTANSLAAQFALWVGEIQNRRFPVQHTFGQYTVQMPCMIETPDIAFQRIESENRNMSILAADVTLKIVLPYFDAPKEGEPNDGSGRNPPGYPVVEHINVEDRNQGVHAQVRVESIHWSDMVDDASGGDAGGTNDE